MRSIATLTLLAGDVLIWGLVYVCIAGAGEVDEAKPTQAAVQVMPTAASHPSRLTAAEVRELTAFHNDARSEVGVGPVEWSAEVAAFAQQWADHIAATGKFEHRPRQRAKPETDSAEPKIAAPADDLPLQIYGENLAFGSGATYSTADGAKAWYAEKKDYEPGTPIPSDFTKFKAGHYTQLVWSKTKRIGAGKAVVQTGEFKGWTVIVCNYDPSGNWEGEVPFGEVQK